MMEPIRVGVREAKSNLSRLLKEIRRGAEVIITDRGVPVAKMAAIGEGESSVLDRVNELERRCLIGRPGPKIIEEGQLPLPIPGEMLQRMLQEDREA